MARTLVELAREALEVQNACNSSGVAQSFARAIIDLGEHTNGTHDRNTHPIVKVWLDKLLDLAEVYDRPSAYDAFKAVYVLAEVVEVSDDT